MRRTPTKVLLVVAAFALFLVPVAAIAAAGFADVADDSVFVADIQWMKDNGITKGCNPPANDRYCPGNNVTREQMSAFMHRLAANRVVDAATAVEADNADKLDGKDSTAFLGRTEKAADSDKLDGLDPYHYTNLGVFSAGSWLDDTRASPGPGGTLIAASAEITVPAAGVLLIQNSSSWDFTGSAYVVHSWVELDTTPGCSPAYWLGAPITGSFSADDVSATNGRANTAGVSAVEVPSAGTYTVHHCLQEFTAVGGVNMDHALAVQWYPAGTASVDNPVAPTGVSSGGGIEGSTSQR